MNPLFKLIALILWVFMTIANGMLVTDTPILRNRLLWTVQFPSFIMLCIICFHA